MDLERLQFRTKIQQLIRTFFSEGNSQSVRKECCTQKQTLVANEYYLELDTPALSSNLIPESCLEVFKTEYISPFSKKRKPLYLVPSPEIYIKKIISQHKINCFQISKCYRNVESCGNIHSPEFTMLEYYTMNATYIDNITITENLFKSLFYNLNTAASKNNFSDLRPPFIRLTIDEAFSKYAGGPISKWFEEEQPILKAASQARKNGINETKENPFENWTLEELYNAIFVQCVEPALPKEHPVVLMDYPAFVNCLAKTKNKTQKYQTTERWELYCRGIELANCYSEETDSKKIQDYFNKEAPLKANNIIPHLIDKNYYKIFDKFPECSGVAMGIDRLIALLANCKSINSILPFPLLS